MTIVDIDTSDMTLKEFREFKTWTPGSLITYDSTHVVRPPDGFFGIGLVVSNVEGFINVLWDSRCSQQFCEYRISLLNHQVISIESRAV